MAFSYPLASACHYKPELWNMTQSWFIATTKTVRGNGDHPLPWKTQKRCYLTAEVTNSFESCTHNHCLLDHVLHRNIFRKGQAMEKCKVLGKVLTIKVSFPSPPKK